jgi:hypothetical protein
MIPGCVVHVLHEVTPKRDVDDLGSAADGEQGKAVGKCDLRHCHVESVLLLVYAVLTAGAAADPTTGCHVAPPGSNTPSANQSRSRAASTSILAPGATG